MLSNATIVYNEVNKFFNKNKSKLLDYYDQEVETEKKEIEKQNPFFIRDLYNKLPLIWNKNKQKFNYTLFSASSNKSDFDYLFTTYYAGSYFGIEQCVDLDSLHFAIKQLEDIHIKNSLFSILFKIMQKSCFSRDGHLAQPLNCEKNFKRMIKSRSISIQNEFFSKLLDLKKQKNDSNNFQNSKAFKGDYREIINNEEIMKNISCIYADPPYTDMQYSRYYHLFNTIYSYEYSEPTIQRNCFTKGLYLNNRYQSSLSQKKSALNDLALIMKQGNIYKIPVLISFAYPQNVEKQKTDRYLFSIEDLIQKAKYFYGNNNVKVAEKEYKHSNQRNSNQKKVIEYIVICKS